MKRTNHNPIILPLPTFEMHSFEAQPRILPFPHRTRDVERRGAKFRGKKSLAEASDAQPRETAAGKDDPTDVALAAVRDRLFRMIVANQWDRSHGNRAS